MARYKLHCFALSGNAYKVALYLTCAGLDWEAVPVDYMQGQTRDSKWREDVNAMGEAPVLEGDGMRLSQSGAILTYLADTTGKFAPSAAQKYDAMRWILFDNHKFTSYFGTHRFLLSFAPQVPEPAVLAFLKMRIEAAFAVVEKHLAGQKFMLGATPTIADFSLVGYMYFPTEETGFDLAKSHPAIHAWTERMKALPGWKHPYDLMPGGRVPLRSASAR